MYYTVRTLFAVCAMLCAAGFSSSAFAQETTYTLSTDGAYASFDSGLATPCDIPPCPVFSAGQRITGSFSTSAPLAANLFGEYLPPSDVTGFSFSNGDTTFALADPNTRYRGFFVSTNGAGAITEFEIVLMRWNMVPPTTGDVATGRLDYLYATHNLQQAHHNFYCNTVVVQGGASTCTAPTTGSDTTAASRTGVNTLTASAATVVSVPTMSEWAMILLAAALAGGAVVMLQRRRMAT